MSTSPDQNEPGHTGRAALHLTMKTASLVMAFVGLEWAFRRVGTLPADAYGGGVILLGALRSWAVALVDVRSLGVLLLALGVTGAVAVVGWRWSGRRAGPSDLLAEWKDLDHGAALRLFIGFVTAIAAWAFSTYDLNLYFDQPHYFDRAFLVALAALVCWRPLFTVMFVPFLVVMIGQFDHPMGGFPWTEANLLIWVLTLFSAAFLLRSITGRSWNEPFLLVVCCLFAAVYWSSGVGKFRIGWMGHRHLNLLILGGYANGWFAFLEPATVVTVSERLAWLNTPLMTATLLLEWGAVLILWRRWTLIAVLVAAIGFHTGIFAYTGMFFWKWIAIEAAFLWFLLQSNRIGELPIFKRPHFALSIVLILSSGVWASPTNLSWYDTPLTYTVRLEGVGPGGTRYDLPTRLFSPYSDTFLLGPFQYLSTNPQMTSVMGAAWVAGVADSLVAATTREQVFEIEARFPGNVFDPDQSRRFDDFVRVFVGNLNARGAKPSAPPDIGAIPHLWSFPRDGAYTLEEPIVHVTVTHVLSFYDGESYADIDRRVLREIPIGEPSP